MSGSIITRSVEALGIALRAGEIVAYPTEGVFGLGCDPHAEFAVRRIHALKGRTPAQGLIMIGSCLAQIQRYIDLERVPSHAMERALASWPGPYTWIFPASKLVPIWVSGTHVSVALRVTAHSDAAAVCNAFGGPIVSTSANLHGFPAARSVGEVRECFPFGIGVLLDRRVGNAVGPSSIRNAVTGEVVRPSAKAPQPT